jgi:4-amino-4-deoxy-L-arabinose transferase-like glycosyltransferase
VILRKSSQYQTAIVLAPSKKVSAKPTAKALSLWLNPSWEWLLLIAILLAVALLHGLNMFHFPYYEDDEGTYMSQAWAIVKEGQLAPYTYWYDHAPLGWIQIALWAILTGGFHTFGSIIQSGRVLMLLMQLGSTFMVYRIGKTLSQSILVATLAALMFALSPYGIYFHRRVLLDNITTFWMLLSILLLVLDRLSLKRVWLSALALGTSILSKELTIFLVPALTYLVYIRADQSHRWFATIGWVTLVSAVISLYILMATLKGELFPTGTLLGGTAPHVSLLATLQFQASRGKDGGLLDLHSGFWKLARIWAQDDPLLVVGGSLCALLSLPLLWSKTQRLLGVLALATLSLWVFLGRGGEIIGFYLVPLLPLLALNVALLLGVALRRLHSALTGIPALVLPRTAQALVAGLCLAGMLVGYTTSPDLGFKSNHFILWNDAQAVAQQEAVSWVETHLPPDSRIMIDQYMWTDLHDNAHESYALAHYYWKVQSDPAIRDKVFHNDWRNIDYVITTIQMLSDAHDERMTLVAGAIEHSTVIAHFDTGGWSIDIRRVNKGHAASQTSGEVVLSQPA